jgi:hypothetical protein
MTPVKNAHIWPAFFYLKKKDYGPNPDARMRKMWAEAIDKSYEQTPNGTSVGVGLQIWDTAVSYPFTQDQLDGLVDGSGRLYLMATAAWTGDDQKRHDWLECVWVESIPSPITDLSTVSWHNCD